MKALGVLFFALVIVAVLALVLALPTMWLWDYLMPTLFGLKTITFGQALAMNLLTGLLFRTTASSK
ncbi:MAG: hypothetical protein ABSC23_03845 [Bryobacteraceae bacterium]|jgi:hypothetical protein